MYRHTLTIMMAHAILLFLAYASIAPVLFADDSAEIAQLVADMRSDSGDSRIKAVERATAMSVIPDTLIEPILYVSLHSNDGRDGLKEQMKRSIASTYAEVLLGKIGERAVPLLRPLVREKSTRWNAVGILKRVGPAASDALPELIMALKDKNENVRSLSAATLYALGPKALPGLDALIIAVKDSSESTREFAIQALGEIGPPAVQAMPVLEGLLKNDDPLTEIYATEALAKIRGRK